MPTNFTGRWTADLAITNFASSQPAALQVNIDHREPDLREELIVTKPDGSEDRSAFSCRTTGEEEHCLLNGKPVRGHARWVNNELVIETWPVFGDRQMCFCDCWSLSPNGMTLIMEHSNDVLAGQRVVLRRLDAGL